MTLTENFALTIIDLIIILTFCRS